MWWRQDGEEVSAAITEMTTGSHVLSIGEEEQRGRLARSGNHKAVGGSQGCHTRLRTLLSVRGQEDGLGQEVLAEQALGRELVSPKATKTDRQAWWLA